MTKIRNYLVLAVLFGLMSLASCQKLDFVPEPDPTVENGTIDAKSSTAMEGVAATNDTIYVEKGMLVTFQALAKGLNIVNWQWSFADDKSYSVGSTTEHKFWLDPMMVTSVTLTGVDAIGTAYVKTKPVKVVWTLDGQPSLICVSCVSNANGGYDVVFAAHKKATSYYPGAYGFTGDMVSPAWTTKTVAVIDTSLNYVNNVLTAPISGAVGKFIVIRMTAISAGYHEFAIGKIVNGNLIWGLFWGPYASNNNMLKFTIENGVVKSYVAPSLPVISGDGNTVCYGATDSSIVLYVNNGAAFSTLVNPFVRFQNAQGVYALNKTQVAVNGFPNWGKTEIKYSEFLMQNLLIFQYGANSATSQFMKNSKYYSSLYNNIQFEFVAGSLKSAQINEAREYAIAHSKL